MTPQIPRVRCVPRHGNGGTLRVWLGAEGREFLRGTRLAPAPSLDRIRDLLEADRAEGADQSQAGAAAGEGEREGTPAAQGRLDRAPCLGGALGGGLEEREAP